MYYSNINLDSIEKTVGLIHPLIAGWSVDGKLVDERLNTARQEVANNFGGVANTNLNVVKGAQSGVFVERLTFNEKGANGVKRWFGFLLPQFFLSSDNLAGHGPFAAVIAENERAGNH
jgi:hypothetical protein